MIDPDADRRRRLVAFWKSRDRQWQKLKAAGIDDGQIARYLPPFPSDLQEVACGARTRKGTPCKQTAIYSNGRCKFHGGCSSGPKTEAGREQSRINGRKGGRPRKNLSPCGVGKS